MVRTSGPPLSLLNDVRREIRAVDRSVALTLTGSLEDFLKWYSYAEPSFSLVLMSALVSLGVFSVIAYTVARRTHEIGIRMALGAGRTEVLWLVLRRGMRLVGLGVGVGLLASFAVTRVIAGQLWGFQFSLNQTRQDWDTERICGRPRQGLRVQASAPAPNGFIFPQLPNLGVPDSASEGGLISFARIRSVPILSVKPWFGPPAKGWIQKNSSWRATPRRSASKSISLTAIPCQIVGCENSKFQI
jgi:hypothetical protein